MSEEATNSVAEGNCVAEKRGGEQSEAKGRSVGKRTRFGGELRRACSFMVKSETRWARWRGGSDVQAAPRGWRRNGRKGWRDKRGDLLGG